MASPDRSSPSLESCLDPEYARKYRQFTEMYSRDGQLLGRDLAYSDPAIDSRISLLFILMGATADMTNELIEGKQITTPTDGMLVGILSDQLRKLLKIRTPLPHRTLNP